MLASSLLRMLFSHDYNKVWHDDVRRPPDDTWFWARTNEQAIAALEALEIDEIVLDHDLGGHNIDPDGPEAIYYKGSSESTGLMLVDWMIDNDKVPAKVVIHSWNSPGALRMLKTLAAKGYMATYRPYEVPK